MQTNTFQSIYTINGKQIGNYLIQSKLGKGSFGTVYKCINLQNSNIYAIKIMKKKKINKCKIQKNLLQSEISILRKINHTNILHLEDFLESENNYYLVFNYCNQGDFEHYLKVQNLTYLSEEKALYFLKQIMNAFQELQKYHIFHRDIKLANIFIHNENVVVGDFGMAKQGDMAESLIGTPLTQAYEILSAKSPIKYTSKTDLWSIGVVYYQMLYGKYPFMAKTIPLLIQDIDQKSQNFIFPQNNQVSNESKHLIVSLLQRDPKQRISWSEFFNHSVFKYAISDVDLLDDNLSIDNKNVLDKVSQAIKKILFTNKEFQNNRKNVKKHPINYMNKQELINYGQNNKVIPNQINEQTINKDQLNFFEEQQEKKSIFKRYKHEKNKIYFIVLTVKKLQKFFKNQNYPQFNDTFMFISLLLMKKAETINKCNIQCIQSFQNVFNLNDIYFQKIIQNQQSYTELMNVFQMDQVQLNNYIVLIQQRMNDKNIYNNKINQLIININPQISKIDEELYNDIKQNRIWFHNKNEQKEFTLLIQNILNSIYCEKYFPYKTIINKQEIIFSWNQFYMKQQQISLGELQKKI